MFLLIKTRGNILVRILFADPRDSKMMFNTVLFFYRAPSQRMNFLLKFIYLLHGE
jgi:hypothetical protein